VGQVVKSFRVEAPLWQAAMARAKREGVTVTDVLTSALATYVAGEASPVYTAPAPAPPAVYTAPPARPAVYTAPRREPGPAQCPPHPSARVHKGLCGACGTNVGKR
jgi:hypothetical protein